MDISRFESLGDNCEFAFVLRRHGISNSSLLRWTRTTPPVLLEQIAADFPRLFRRENLFPYSARMVLDRGSGIAFHSRLVRNRRLVEDDDALYREDLQKIMYLRYRLRQQLRDPRMIFIFKDGREDPAALDDMEELARLIARRGGGALLFVSTCADLPVGMVEQRADHFYLARIDAFAPYGDAKAASYEVWSSIIEAADRMIAPGRRPLRAAAGLAVERLIDRGRWEEMRMQSDR